MDELPPRQRQVLYLITCEQLSQDEVADVLGISKAAVKSNLSLARKAMRERLRELYLEVCGRAHVRRESNVTNDCHNLDAYFDGELAPGERCTFRGPPRTCPTCREAIDEQHWIDGLFAPSHRAIGNAWSGARRFFPRCARPAYSNLAVGGVGRRPRPCLLWRLAGR